ncbi:MAG: ABC transporter ATP-binding protein [Synergistaceae bacterium]|nr:ABC transporter ATP-binding protein [Synergistaceae bacterium]
MAKIEVMDVSLEYNDGEESFLALENINLTIDQGEFVCVIGPSGCGKSTLLSLMGGFIFPTKGKITIDSCEVRGPGKDRCVVFQHYSLFAWFTAIQNVALGVKQVAGRLSSKEINDISRDALEKVGLGDYANKYPYQLSGGMQQRVAIARGLAMNPQILLMDEPFGAIDTRNRLDLQDLLLDLCARDENRKTVVFITHDVDEAIYLADRIVFMNPKVVTEDIRVNFGNSRNRDEIFASDAFMKLQRHLVSLFYRHLEKKIWKNVAL